MHPDPQKSLLVDLWGKLQVPSVNTQLLKRFKDVAKYHLSPVNLQHLPQTTYVVNRITLRLNLGDHEAVVRLFQQTLDNPEYQLNFSLHLSALNLCNNVQTRSKLKSNAHNILFRLIKLHVKECNLFQKHPDNKRLQYLNIPQKLMKDKSCVLCARGAYLFYEFMFTKTFCIANESEAWQCLDFTSLREFRYCPLHANINNHPIDSNPSALIKYHCYVSQVHHKRIHLYTILIHYAFDMMKFALAKHQFKIFYQVAKLVFQSLIRLMEYIQQQDSIQQRQTLTVDLHTQIKSVCVYKSYINTMLRMAFSILCDMNEFEVCKKFGAACSKFLSETDEHIADEIHFLFCMTKTSAVVAQRLTLDPRILYIKDIPNYFPGIYPELNIKKFSNPILWLIFLNVQKEGIVNMPTALKLMKTRVENKALTESNPYIALSLSLFFNENFKANYIFNEIFNDFMVRIFLPFRQYSDHEKSKLLMPNGMFASVFFSYALFLFNIKSQKGCKYFEYCLQLRPFNAYFHSEYAMYLFKVIKDYKLSYYHMKLCKKLQPNLYTLKLCKRFRNVMISRYDIIMLLLVTKLQHTHPCQFKKCKNICGKKFVCKGCKCSSYCSKKCQKLDWINKHRNVCISKYSADLNSKQKETISKFDFMIKQLLTSSSKNVSST